MNSEESSVNSGQSSAGKVQWTRRASLRLDVSVQAAGTERETAERLLAALIGWLRDEVAVGDAEVRMDLELGKAAPDGMGALVRVGWAEMAGRN